MGSAPDPAGGPYSATPDPLAGFKGSYFKGEGKERGKKGGEGKGERSGGKGGRGEGKGKMGGDCPSPFRNPKYATGGSEGGVGMEAEKTGGEGKGPCLDVFLEILAPDVKNTQNF